MVWAARPCSSRAAPGLRDFSMLDTPWPRELRIFFLLGALSVTQRKLFLPHLEMRQVHAAMALLTCVWYLSCFGGPVSASVSISVVVSRSGTQIRLRIFTFPKQRKQAAIPSPAGLTVHPFMETLKRLSSCYVVKGIL